jgi:ZIP family zinc transporter
METSMILIAFLFSFIAGVSTGLSSLSAFFMKDLKRIYLSSFMGFSAGVMIQIFFVELFFSAVMDAGFLYANISFFLGALTIAIIDFL